MSTRSGLFALTGVGLMVLMAVGPGAAVAAHSGNTQAGNAQAGNTFGMQVSSFVHGLLASGNTGNQPMGQLVSEFVTSNNPGADKKPGHAGPPTHAGGQKPTASEQGASTNGNGNGGGPPKNPGNSGGNGGPPDNPGNSGGNGGGPPSQAGGPSN